MNIADWIEKWARATPNKAALRFADDQLSYARFNDEIKTHARMLRNKLGIAPGDRVAHLGQNHPRMLITLFACARLGAIFVPLNWRLAPREHLHMLRHCAAAVLVVDEPYVSQCERFRAETPDCLFVAMNDNDPVGWPKLDDLLRDAVGEDHHPGSGFDDPLLLIYTSGTTGAPKGAVLKQAAVQANALNSVLLHDMTSQDVILTILPLFHVGGLNVQTTAALYRGATVILHRAFAPRQTLDCLLGEKPTLTIILPAHMEPLQSLPDWATAKIPLRAVLTGSSAIPDEMTRHWHGRGIPLLNMYGSSETAPIAIHQSVTNAFATVGTVGFPAMHCAIRIVDEADQDCRIDEPGEILVRGPNVMSYYWNDEEATRNAFINGWFRTGDIGTVDTGGCYRILDRKKDVIISGGENIYPAEIENILLSHPSILEAVVVRRRDMQWGEIPVAVIVARPASRLDKKTVLDWFNGKIGRYKHPKDVVFVDALPRNAMGKVVKHVLRDTV
ncbi:MAG: AMP-binding protein [Azonexus sp.]|jgi:fatty-acyl-CoA synthase|nr:AMP-binding protein [Azonexus sp.]